MPDNPSCNYESQGIMCTFYEENQYASLPYPEDVTFGPVSDPIPSAQGNPELSAILTLLNEQKTATEKQEQLQREQAAQMRDLQQQVTNLMNRSVPEGNQVPVSSVVTSFTTSSTLMATSSINSLPTAASTPQVISSAAAHLNAALQSGLSSTNQDYQGITMGHLRSNPQLVSTANTVLANATQHVPPLNPLSSIGQPLSLLQNQVSSVDQLYRATTINKQLRCHEFASTGQFSYHNMLKADNCNVAAFACGAFKPVVVDLSPMCQKLNFFLGLDILKMYLR